MTTDAISIRVTLPSAELRVLDAWQAAHGIRSRNDAIRRLVQLGMKVASASNDEIDIEAAPD